VLLSGTLWTGTASRLVDALLDGVATLCLSASVLAEFEEVIQREKFRLRLEQSGRSAAAILSQFRAVAVVVEPAAIPVPAALRDPDDIHVLACAVAAGADVIVSGDGDLLVLKSFEGIPIVRVRTMLEMLGLPVE
jgi:putative PIN family toxin of toxin-antitoxin system